MVTRALGGVLAALLLGLAGSTAAAPAAHPAQGPVPDECAVGQANPPAATAANELLDAIGASRIGVSYVFVIDTSASVRPYYGSLTTALGRFLRALGPDDRVSVVTFSERAYTAVPLGPLASVSDVLSALPAANGSYSDIGLGVEQAVNELQDVPSDHPGAVVLFTDGAHNPNKDGGSRYPEQAGSGWDALRERAAQLGPTRPIDAYAIPLTSELSGVRLLCSVFPGAERLPVGSSIESLTRYLQRAQTAARIQAAGELLMADRGQGVAVEWLDLPRPAVVGAGSASAVPRLRNTAPHLSVVIDAPRVIGDGDLPDVSATLPPRIELGPGQVQDLSIMLTWRAQQASSPFGGEVDYRTTLTLAGTVTSPVAAGLTELQVPGGPVELQRSAAGEGLLEAVGDAAWNPWPLALLLALLAAGVWLVARSFPAMSGIITIHRAPEAAERDDQDREVADVELVGHRVRSREFELAADTGVRVIATARRALRGGRPHLRVTLRLSGRLGRTATRTIPWGQRRLILGLEIRHQIGTGRPSRPTTAQASSSRGESA